MEGKFGGKYWRTYRIIIINNDDDDNDMVCM